MELKEVIGRRRSIRIFASWRPVEREKIQKMLEAARRASCAGNVMNVRAVVIWRDQAPPELLKSIKLPISYQQMQTAPVFILWYNEPMAYEGAHWVETVSELVETRRMGENIEETKEEVKKKLAPGFLLNDPLMTGNTPGAIMDCGQAIAQATLGSKITVLTLDDRKVTLTVPRGTPSGKRFRVRGQGVTHGDKTGDLLVEIQVVVPEKLTAEQERLMKQFAAAGNLEY